MLNFLKHDNVEILLCAAFKWDSTLNALNYIFFSPLKLFNPESSKKEVRNKQKRK